MSLHESPPAAGERSAGRRLRTPPPAAKGEIRILLLEDNPTDADLVRHALRRGGVVHTLEHVDAKSRFIQRLEQAPPDLILSDFSLPTLDGYEALETAQHKCP